MSCATIHNLDINPKLIAAFSSANLVNCKDILLSSVTDLQSRVKLSGGDVGFVKKEVAKLLYQRKSTTVKSLISTNRIKTITTGSSHLDALLNGGVCNRGITEIYGESATAKTQLCLQLSLNVQLPPSEGGLSRGAAYICTEDAFPTRRLAQMSTVFCRNHGNQPDIARKPCDNVYIQHIADSEQLIICLQHKLPMLCTQRKIGLIVLDSIAAPFRGRYNVRETVARSKDLAQIAAALFKLSHTFKIPIVCVNQVTASMGDNAPPSPSLGLAWSNHVTSRFCTSRQAQPDGRTKRTFGVVFSPWVPNGSCNFKITEAGVTNDD